MNGMMATSTHFALWCSRYARSRLNSWHPSKTPCPMKGSHWNPTLVSQAEVYQLPTPEVANSHVLSTNCAKVPKWSTRR